MDGDGAGEVVDLRSRRGYEADLRGLASGQLAAARAKLGLSFDGFAELLGSLLSWQPTAEVVETWETSVVPPGDVLLAAMIAMQDVPGEVLTLPLNAGATRTAELLSALSPAIGQTLDSDVVASYASRGEITRTDWNKIISGSSEHLWLYGMAEFGYASDDEVPSILADAGSRGCQVRVLLLDPHYPRTIEIDEEEGNPPGTLTPRIRAALRRFGSMRDECGPAMQIRVYDTHPTVSIVRGDDRMLVTPYVRYFIGSNSPTFELRAGSLGKMFDRYARHFDQVWRRARDWTP